MKYLTIQKMLKKHKIIVLAQSQDVYLLNQCVYCCVLCYSSDDNAVDVMEQLEEKHSNINVFFCILISFNFFVKI